MRSSHIDKFACVLHPDSDPSDIGLWVDESSQKAVRSYLNETRRRDGWYTVYRREIRRYDILNKNVVATREDENWRGHRGWEAAQAAAPRDALLGGPPVGAGFKY
jgi:hypothetical protein